MLDCRQFEVDREEVRKHYDRLSILYKFLWGEHLHHGYWENNESIRSAQIKLIERLAEKANVPRGGHVLDIGCGIGGSAFWLADRYDCCVTGLTISPVQAKMASKQANVRGQSRQLQFLLADANDWMPEKESVDVVWIMESSEHFQDKAAFFRKCAIALKPKGVLAVCAWLRGERQMSATDHELVATIAKAMFSASLDTLTQYATWMREAGLRVVAAEDITRNVSPTWDYCSRMISRAPFRWLVNFTDQPTHRFVDAFPLMQQAYHSGAMAFGLFVAKKL